MKLHPLLLSSAILDLVNRFFEKINNLGVCFCFFLLSWWTDYNFNPPRDVGFMTAIPSTSGRLHDEFIRILFLQTHWETDRFFSTSGVMSSQSDRGFFHYFHVAFTSMLKSRVVNILANLDANPANRATGHPSPVPC